MFMVTVLSGLTGEIGGYVSPTDALVVAARTGHWLTANLLWRQLVEPWMLYDINRGSIAAQRYARRTEKAR
jgi:hypothetical protein